MRLVKVEVKYFRPFFQADAFALDPHMNIVVGRNNSGKSALLEALEAKALPNKPHVSRLTPPRAEDPASVREPYVMLEYAAEASEVRDILRSHGITRLTLPRRKGQTGSAVPEQALKLVKEISEGDREFTFSYRVRLDDESLGGRLQNLDPVISTQGVYGPPDNAGPTFRLNPPFDGIVIEDILRNPTPREMRTSGREEALEAAVALAINERTYRFLAERSGLGISGYSESATLHPSCRNLPSVLSHLAATDRPRFQRYEALVHRVLPSVHGIGSRPIGSDRTEVTVWNFERVEGRPDLARPLLDSGTGTGQVLAILFIVVTSTYPSIIIIDEPQSFLHPGAARELVDVLRENPQHQYIIATHSPHVISAALPARLLQINHDGDQSTVAATEVSRDDLARIWDDLGVRLSDVFGLEGVLWVEGNTEVKCFKQLLGLSEAPGGVEILAVRSTSNFAKKKRLKEALDLYVRLSSSGVLLPPAIGFVFDREALTDADITDLKKLAHPVAIDFLPRPMIENYLVEPEAIAAILQEDDGLDGTALTAEEVRQYINQKYSEASESEKVPGRSVPATPTEWTKATNAAALLRDIFAGLTNHRVAYQKPEHGPRLVDWLMRHDRAYLNDLAEFVGGFATSIGLLDSPDRRRVSEVGEPAEGNAE